MEEAHPAVSVARRTLARALRLVGQLSVGRRIGTELYRILAGRNAGALLRLPGVEAVYLTGTALRPELIDPGASDIDLVIVARFDSTEEELAFRREARRAHARLNVAGALFYNLDYIDAVDLPYFRSFGGAWAIHLDQAGVCLAGTAAWRAPAMRPAAELAHERFRFALRRWMNTGGRLLDPTFRVDRRLRRHHARRLFLDVASAVAGVDRTEPVARVFSAVQGTLAEGQWSVLRRAALGEDAAAGDFFFVEGALALLTQAAHRIAAHFRAPWRTKGVRQKAEVAPELRARLSAVLADGIEGIAVVPLGPNTRGLMPLFVSPAGLPATETISLGQRALATWQSGHRSASDPWRRPALLTEELWQLGALIEPVPFVGAGLMTPIFVGGRLPAPPLAPSGQAFDATLRAACIDEVSRLRSHGLRFGRSSVHERTLLELQLDQRLPALHGALDDGLIDIEWSLLTEPPRTISEEEMVDRCRHLSSALRLRYAAALTPRHSGAE